MLTNDKKSQPKVRVGAGLQREQIAERPRTPEAQENASPQDIQSPETNGIELGGNAITPDEVTQPTISRDDALSLDEDIRNDGVKFGEVYLTLGRNLYQMKTTHGYLHLDFTSWEDYLKSKRFGRTMLSYFLRLGEAQAVEDLNWIVQRSVSATVLTMYAAAPTPAAKLPKLIRETIDDVEGLPVRKVGPTIKAYVEAHAEEYGKPSTKVTRKEPGTGARKAPSKVEAHENVSADPSACQATFKDRLITMYADAEKADQVEGTSTRAPAFLAAMAEFFAEHQAKREAV